MSERYYNDFTEYVENTIGENEVEASQNDFEKLVNYKIGSGSVNDEYHSDMEKLAVFSGQID